MISISAADQRTNAFTSWGFLPATTEATAPPILSPRSPIRRGSVVGRERTWLSIASASLTSPEKVISSKSPSLSPEPLKSNLATAIPLPDNNLENFTYMRCGSSLCPVNPCNITTVGNLSPSSGAWNIPRNIFPPTSNSIACCSFLTARCTVITFTSIVSARAGNVSSLSCLI